jgi:hypothetical protein
LPHLPAAAFRLREIRSLTDRLFIALNVAPTFDFGISSAFLDSVKGNKERAIFLGQFSSLDFFRGFSMKKSSSPISIIAETPPNKKLPAQVTKFMIFLLY